MDALLDARARGRGIRLLEDAARRTAPIMAGAASARSVTQAASASTRPRTSARWATAARSPPTTHARRARAPAALARRASGYRHACVGTHGAPRRAPGRDPARQATPPRRCEPVPPRRRRGALRGALGKPDSPSPPAADGDHVFHLFVVRSPQRGMLQNHLDASGIANAIHYPTPIHLQPAYADLGMEPGSLPVAERLAAFELLPADLPDDRGRRDRADRSRRNELRPRVGLAAAKKPGSYRRFV